MPTVLSLPAELLIDIAPLATKPGPLLKVCRTFQDITTLVVYHNISLRYHWHIEDTMDTELLLRTIISRPALRALVWHLRVSIEVFEDELWPYSDKGLHALVMEAAGAVTWSSKKQSLITLSSTEAEYIAESHAGREIAWLQSFMDELGIPTDEPTTLHIDNQSTIAIAKDNKSHARTKHIDICYHFIWEAIRAG